MTPIDDAVITGPDSLANAYGDYLLIIGENGKAEEGTEIPEEIYLRYELKGQLLYVDKRVFQWLDLPDVLQQWSKTLQYGGMVTKRLTSGTGRTDKPKRVAVFDLSVEPEPKPKAIRRGRRKRIKEHNIAVANKVTVTMAELTRQMAYFKEHYPDMVPIEDVEILYKKFRTMLEEANRTITRGKKPGPKPGRRVRKNIPANERIVLSAIDTFLGENIHAVHRILKRYVKDGAKFKWQDKQIKPDIPMCDWIARYEEESNMLSGYTNKTLYIPVSVLNAMEELKDYFADYRYAGKRNVRVGESTSYCAVFHLNRIYTGE